MRRWWMTAATALGLLASTAAWGREPPAAPLDDADERQARQLFLEGSRLYEQARYDDAITRFQAAYRLSARPDLLFNIAQAYRLEGPTHCGTALAYYERHLREEPEASNRTEIEELMGEMRRCAAAETATRALPELRVERGARPASRWPLWTAVVGGAVLVTGAAGYTASRIEYQSVKDEAPYPPGTFRRWEIATDASYALVAAGGAAVTVSLLAVWRRARHRLPVTLSWNGRAVGLQGHF